MTLPPRPLKFQQGDPIVDPSGRPLPYFLRNLNNALDLANYLADLQAATDAANAAAAAAQTAADNAQGAADATLAETSIVNSYVTNFAGASVLSVDNTGLVTILNHDRVYGDPALNPTVAVTGDTVATAATLGQTVRIFYDDPARAGGAVTYQFTVDPADPPVQGGDRHSVGAATVPGAGSSDGGWVRPPGFTGDIP